MKTYTVSLALLGLMGCFSAVSAKCGCVTCGQDRQIEWVCVPQVVNRSLEVTEWGVVDDPICRTPCRSCCTLFGRGRSTNCDAAGCDGAACDAACRNTGLGCHRSGPRLRKKLMRKELVYSIPVVEYVAQPRCRCCSECDASGMFVSQAVDTLPRKIPAISSVPRVDSDVTTYWINIAKSRTSAESMQNRDMESQTESNGVVEASFHEKTSDASERPPSKIFWINGPLKLDDTEDGTIPSGIEKSSSATRATQPRGVLSRALQVERFLR